MAKVVAARLLKIHPEDNVAVAAEPVAAGMAVLVDGDSIVVGADIPAGHKVAIEPLEAGAQIVKYGFPIGAATAKISPGEWVHEHNLRTRLGERVDYRYEPGAQGSRAPIEAAAEIGRAHV